MSMTPFRSTFELTFEEQEVLRAAAKDPADYIAMPIAVEIDQSRPVDLLRLPASAQGPARRVIRVPFMVGIDATMLEFSQLVGVNGKAARNPVEGVVGFMPARMILPQRNFTAAGRAAVEAHVATERAAHAAAQREWEPSVERADAPQVTTRRITILDAKGNRVDPSALPDDAILVWDIRTTVEVSPLSMPPTREGDPTDD